MFESAFMYYLKEWHMVPSPNSRWKEGVAFVQSSFFLILGFTNIYKVNLRFGEDYRHDDIGLFEFVDM